jgi:hypothetical protein
VDYLVSIKDTLTKEEMDKLKKTNMFLAASSAPGAIPARLLAADLHEPTAENIALGLKVLDWKGATWQPTSPAGTQSIFCFV